MRSSNWKLLYTFVALTSVCLLFHMLTSSKHESIEYSRSPLSLRTSPLSSSRKPLESWQRDTLSEYAISPESRSALGTTPEIRRYYLEISDGDINIDGIKTTQTLINNQYPGPLIQANIGDTLIVNVRNRGTHPVSLHFHGMDQNNTNFMDGAAGVTQCPIKAHQSFEYSFVVRSAGTYWYHNHIGVEYARGLVGPMVVHDPNHQSDYGDDIIVLLSDVYQDLDAALTEYFEPYIGGSFPLPDKVLMQGTKQPSATITSSKRARVRLINASSCLNFHFTVDDHSIEVIEVDGFHVKPRAVSTIPIATGQRYSFLLDNISGTLQEHWMRARVDTAGIKDVPAALKEESRGVLVYPDFHQVGHANLLRQNPSKRFVGAFNEFDLEFEPLDVAPLSESEASLILHADMGRDSFGVVMGMFNNTRYHRETSGAHLDAYLLKARRHHHHKHVSTIRTFMEAIEVDLVLKNLDDAPHPFHIHGHQCWVLGRGSLKGYPALEMEARIPIKRDTFWVDSESFIKLRLRTDNPGLWLIHCHNIWHAHAGMEFEFVSLPQQLSKQQASFDWMRLCS